MSELVRVIQPIEWQGRRVLPGTVLAGPAEQLEPLLTRRQAVRVRLPHHEQPKPQKGKVKK